MPGSDDDDYDVVFERGGPLSRRRWIRKSVRVIRRQARALSPSLPVAASRRVCRPLTAVAVAADDIWPLRVRSRNFRSMSPGARLPTKRARIDAAISPARETSMVRHDSDAAPRSQENKGAIDVRALGNGEILSLSRKAGRQSRAETRSLFIDQEESLIYLRRAREDGINCKNSGPPLLVDVINFSFLAFAGMRVAV